MNDPDTQHAEPVTPERRKFLIGLSAGLAGLAGLLIGIPFVGFLIAPVRRPAPDVWRPVGSVDDFDLGQMVKVTYLDPEPLPWAGFIAESAVWLDRTHASFWVPALHGKIDTNPGRVNIFWLHPDRPGVYRGQCAEFCGTQHALMGFLVVAEPRDAFDSWIEQRRQTATPPAEAAAARGQEVFELGGCNQCHAVNGIFEPLVRTGPDLTHLASRRTLAAATVPNTSEHLRAFIRDPHARKPGVRMPANPLPDEDLDALVAFLQGLQ